MEFSGILKKMRTSLASTVEYRLGEGDSEILLNRCIGSEISLRHTGTIVCLGCDKETPKSYGGGFCFQCLNSLPECDMCMMKPELCHHEFGTCRDSKWGEEHCMKPHKVYLARSSDIKVGITRENPVEIRWMDQGAIEGMVIAEVPTRKDAGRMEVALASVMQDKTDFRKMLKGEVADGSLEDRFRQIAPLVPDDLKDCVLEDRKSVHIRFPLNQPPGKIKAVGFDSEDSIRAVLRGIKGQYLVFDDFVFNVRAHSGYQVMMTVAESEEAGGAASPDEPGDLFDMM